METQTINELLFNIQRGQQSMNFFLQNGIAGTATALLQLYQLVCRLHRERLLSGGEVRKMESFLKATKGNYEIFNIPFPADGQRREGKLSKIQKSMDRMGIRYHVLPCLNQENPDFQVCIYREDQQKFQAFFTDYLDQQLSGKEIEERDLTSLTNKRASIVSIPSEEMRGQIREDFKSLKVNYACLPDLNVGDGQSQYLIANADLPKVRHWYSLYRDSLLKAGIEGPEELKSMSLDDYQQTAVRTSEGYIQGADEMIRRSLDTYEGQAKGMVEEKLAALDHSIHKADHPAVQKYLQSSQYVQLSIDHESLVANPGAASIAAADPSVFACRIPGTYGPDENFLVVPSRQVFMVQDASRARYIAFIRRDQQPMVLDAHGARLNRFSNGNDLFTYFDHVDSQFKNKKLQQLGETVQKTIAAAVPKPAPQMAK